MIPELLYLALEFYREPRRFDHLRDPNCPLPAGLTELLAAPGSVLAPDQLAATAAALNASEDDCLNCLPFFVKQVLLEPQGDYYRALGVARDAELALIKEHYRYLIRLFHPDKDVDGEAWDDLYAPRINEAYNSLRNPAKRAEYNATMPAADGFNPGELALVGQPAGPAVPSTAPPPRAAFEAPALLRKPWFYGAVFVAVVALFLGLLVSSNNSSQLTVTAQPRAESDSGEIEEASPTVEAQVVWEQEREGYGEPSDTVAARNAPTASDRRIEALIKARVAQATTAVLGSPKPRAKSKPAPPPTAEPVVREKRKPQPDVIVAAEEPVVVAEVSPAESDSAAPIAEAAIEPEIVPVLAEPVVVVRVEPEPEPEVVIQPQPEMVAQAEPETSTVPEPDLKPELVHEISAQELHALLSEFTQRYQTMDAAGFAALFAPDAHTSESDGRRKIQRMYTAFFQENTIHGFSFKNVAWHAQSGASRTGSALAIIASAPAAGGSSSVVQATISFQVERGANNALLISRMTY